MASRCRVGALSVGGAAGAGRSRATASIQHRWMSDEARGPEGMAAALAPMEEASDSAGDGSQKMVALVVTEHMAGASSDSSASLALAVVAATAAA